MKRKSLEALAEAIAQYSGYSNPDGILYASRNPGGLKSVGQPEDTEGNRTFRSVIDGYQALFYDVELKVSGKSRAHLAPTATLIDLSIAYNLPLLTARAWAGFLRKALHDPSITASTPLSHFLQE